MLGGFPGVRRWAETADVYQSAMLRLVNALRAVKPKSGQDFFALATLQIRRELLDLARHYYGAEGIGANHASQAKDAEPPDQADLSHEPHALAQWTELHRHIDALPAEEREIVGLLFYQGLSQAEAATVLNLSLRTLQRRWHEVLMKLQRVWQGEVPPP